MSLTFTTWMGNVGSLVATQHQARAAIQWARIQDKATDLSLRRGNTTLEPQTVRVELDDIARQANSAAGIASIRTATIFGIRGHAELDDTDIEIGDRFVMDDVEYTVVSVNRQMIGALQAYCESVG